MVSLEEDLERLRRERPFYYFAAIIILGTLFIVGGSVEYGFPGSLWFLVDWIAAIAIVALLFRTARLRRKG
jgi:uncharacterized membrane protein